jgi:WD40 repeat protein
MLTTLPQRVRASLAPTPQQQQPSSGVAASSAAPTTLRLSTRANVTATSFLPRANLASSFGASLLSSASPLESNLNAVYGLALGGGASELVVRSLLTPAQVAHLTQQAALAAQAENEDAANVAASAIDSAPIQATLSLRSTGEIHAIECLSDRLMVIGTAAGDATMIELQSDTSGGSFFRKSASPGASLRASHTFSLSSHALTGLASSVHGSTPLLAACSDDGSVSVVQPFTRTVLRRVQAHPSALACIEFSGSTLFTAGQGGTITGWDVRAMTANAAGGSKPTVVLSDQHAVSITALAMHPTRPFNLAAASTNGALSIFDVRQSGRPLCSIQAQRSVASDLLYLPWSPNTLASVSEDGSLCAFDFAPADGLSGLAAGEDIFTKESVESRMVPRKLAQHTAGLNTISVDRDTRTILAGADSHGMIVVNGL